MRSRTRITAFSMARKPPAMSSIRQPLHLIQTLLLAQSIQVLLPTSSSILFANANENHFCGETWVDAFEHCHAPCPSADDAECPDGMSCHGYTGCAAKYNPPAGGGGAGNSGNGNGGEGSEITLEDDTYKNNMCGTSWLTAMLSCSTPCPPGTACPGGQTCFAATNCDKPIEPIVSKLIMSLLGDYEGETSVSMSTMERGVFSESVLAFLAEKMEDNKVAIGGADVTGQEFVEQGGRRLGKRGLSKRYLRQYWNDTITGSGFEIEFGLEENKYGRRLPTYSSALDVSMTITGEYRPPPYQDIDLLVEESINRASANMVQDLRRRGSQGGTAFFERVEDMSAVRQSKITERPTKSPTDWPTDSPSNEPTDNPTLNPTADPTATPSVSPTRAFEQMLQTGSGTDLYSDTAKSFGNLFEIKTKSSSETVLIKGIDFYSSAEPNKSVQYEVWTKDGTWQGSEGQLQQYTKIAEGSALSKGACEEATAGARGERCNDNFVQIPFDKFENVAIKGGGESRSFYITLTTKDIMYRRGEGSGDQVQVQAENLDIEIYEGAGVLAYPFTSALENYHYSRPRAFLGRVWYERNPCKNGGNEWPCETRSPITSLQATSKKPTQRPTPKPTKMPTPEPTGKPTLSKVGQQQPPQSSSFLVGTPAPTIPAPTIPMESNLKGEIPTSPPSLKPVVDFEYNEEDVKQTNIVVRLHNILEEGDVLDGLVMNEREQNKYSEILMDYIRSHPSVVGASVDVLNVTVWHQEAFVPKKIKIKKKKSEKSKVKKGKGRKRALRALQEKEDGTVAIATELDGPKEEDEAIEELLTTAESSTFPDTETGKYGSLSNAINEVGNTPEEDAMDEQQEEAKASLPSLQDTAIDQNTSIPSPSSITDDKESSMDVTTIIHTVNSVLPADVTDVLILHVIEDGAAELIDRFHAETFYSFFHDIDDISGKIILTVTNPPTTAPTTVAQFLANINVDIYGLDEEVDQGSYNIYTWVGLLVGGLWCILTLFSLCHVLKARSQMNNKRMLNTRRSRETIPKKKGQSHTSVFDSLIGDADFAEKMDYTAKTHQLVEDMTSSGGSGGCDEEDQGGNAETDQTTFADLFGRVSALNTGAGQSNSTDLFNENERTQRRNSTFNERLQVKLSTAGGGAPPRSDPQTSNTQFEERLQKKLSSNTMNEAHHSEGPSSEGGSISEESESSRQSLNRMSKKKTKFEERLQVKLSTVGEENPKASIRASRRSSFEERLQVKLSSVGGETPNASNRQKRHTFVGAGAASFDERLQVKLSSVEAPNTSSNAQMDERIQKKLGSSREMNASNDSNEEKYQDGTNRSVMTKEQQQNDPQTFKGRLQAKLSQVGGNDAQTNNESKAGNKPPRPKRHTITGSTVQKAADPFQSLLTSAGTSDQDSANEAAPQRPRPQRRNSISKPKNKEAAESANNIVPKGSRRSSTDDMDTDEGGHQQNRRSTDGDGKPLKKKTEKAGKHATSQRRRNLERKDSSRSNHSKQSTKKANEKRHNNEGGTRRLSHDKDSSGKSSSLGVNKNSRDQGGGGGGSKAPSNEKKLGTNMVEMLFV